MSAVAMALLTEVATSPILVSYTELFIYILYNVFSARYLANFSQILLIFYPEAFVVSFV